ncbi:MAG: diaminopimelate epimerase [Rhizobiaceae bacterium]
MGNLAPFYKMNGLGNKIIVADMRGRADKITAAAAIALSLEAAIPFDQIMEIRDASGKEEDFAIRILNCDGSEAGACGNGTRCVVAWLNREEEKPEWVFRTLPGLLYATTNSDDTITVDMGVPHFGWEDIPLEEYFEDTTGIELQIGPIDAPVLHTPSVANMGNPHAVFWVSKDVWDYDLDRFGPMLENHPVFPDRANISVAQVFSPTHIKIRTWERGVGLTEACGSAACATLVCAVRKELSERKVTITVPGGDLTIEWDRENHVQMTGPVEFEFSGEFDPETGDFTRDDEAS